MTETIRLIGRNSRLSLLQIELLKKKIEALFSTTKVEVIARSSKGDSLQEIPLHTVEGSDFFTADIFAALQNGEADIAVHSLKDMSSEHFFGTNYFAVIDRDDVRDIAIFNSNVEQKLSKGEPIIVGTCSPRREEMAVVFLKNSLPQLSNQIDIVTKPIRGNVETRLKKLNSGEYDGTILATAGLNRLLRSELDKELINSLLFQKKMMLLPLIDCVPAPCQGAIVAEANPSNKRAVEILKAVNNEKLFNDCYAEKKEASAYGSGCIQKFGVTTFHTKHRNYRYAAGVDENGTSFKKWSALPNIDCANLYSTTDVIKDFFTYQWVVSKDAIVSPVVFVANYKSIQNEFKLPANKIILASGTRTWLELAKKGYWVTGSADALGFEFLLSSLSMPLFKWQKKDITILTHTAAAQRWKQKGYSVVSNYHLLSANNKKIQEAVANADAIFWSSYSQFEFYGSYAKQFVKHLCAGGETAELLIAAGIEPVIFPTIKAFEQWRKSIIHSHNAA